MAGNVQWKLFQGMEKEIDFLLFCTYTSTLNQNNMLCFLKHVIFLAFNPDSMEIVAKYSALLQSSKC